MRARAVIGANFGDEGKGLVTDFLCSQGAGCVVRFNGGANAGHTVVTPDGRRHVFSHFGSGSFLGVPTFLSQFFVCNPILFVKEWTLLNDMGLNPGVYAHPNCLVTTFADMIINQTLEDRRADKRHGSCGVGMNETIMRSELPHLKITMSDLWNRTPLKDRLVEICKTYAEFRTGKPIDDHEKLIELFMKWCEGVADKINPAGIQQCSDPVFEGAQGLLLDMDNKEFYPHLTRSHTGSRNVKALCAQAGISDIELYYVSRTYMTRHGAGPLPGYDERMSFHDDTNAENTYQGAIRFAPLNFDQLLPRCAADAGGDYKLVLTHCDQAEPPIPAHLYSFGPTRNDVEKDVRKAVA